MGNSIVSSVPLPKADSIVKLPPNDIDRSFSNINPMPLSFLAFISFKSKPTPLSFIYRKSLQILISSFPRKRESSQIKHLDAPVSSTAWRIVRGSLYNKIFLVSSCKSVFICVLTELDGELWVCRTGRSPAPRWWIDGQGNSHLPGFSSPASIPLHEILCFLS